MASTGKCEYCGATLLSTDPVCPQCGAPNPNYSNDNNERKIFHPRTIDELKQYCSERGMPLLKMRFFIGEDFREPKAFGIYQNGSEYVVYKNKADGSRAIRYQGSDEAHAVNELLDKLMEECSNRGIYPDGAPEKGAQVAKQRNLYRRIVMFAAIAGLVVTLGGTAYQMMNHRHDGYYHFDDGIYYHYGDNWYTDTDYGWVESEPVYQGDSSQYYLGEDYSSGWGVSDFKESAAYEEIKSQDSTSSDYDSWDSNDTDWDTDW